MLVAAMAGAVGPLASDVRAQGLETGPRRQRVEKDLNVLIGDGMTLTEARRQAIDAALAEAVREVVGVRIDALEQRLAREGAKIEDRFLSVVQSSASGRVVDYTVLSEGVVAVPDATGRPLNYFRGRVSALVAEEVGVPDPGFTVKVTTNRPVYVAKGEDDSEEIVTQITASQPAYVTLFNVSDDAVQVMLPSQRSPDNRVQGGVGFEFPSERQRQLLGLRVRAWIPPGTPRLTELMVAVATKRPIPFGGDARRRTESVKTVPTVQATLSQLQEWLVSIPLDERAVGFASYEIRRASR